MSTGVQNVVYALSLRDGLTRGLDNANNSANKLEGTLGNVQGLLGKLGLTLGVAGMAMFAKGIVDAGSKVESATIGLTTLLKDAAEAKQVIENTMADAKATPFAFEGLLQANKAIIAAGVGSKEARADILNLANAIAATGGGDDELQRMVINLQQIKNVGKASALDIKQFAYAGINITKVLAAAGIQGEVTYENLTKALKIAHEQGGIYYNGLENMAGSTAVKMSNLGDSIFQLKVKMFNDLKPAIDAAIKAGYGMIEWLKNAWNWVYKNRDAIQSFAKAILAAWLAVKTIAVAKAIFAGISFAIQGMAAVAAGGAISMGGFAASVTAAMGPVALLAAAVGGLVLAFNMLSDAEDRRQKGKQDIRDLGTKYVNETFESAEKGYRKELSLEQNIANTRKQIIEEAQQKQTEYSKKSRDAKKADNDKDMATYKGIQAYYEAVENSARAWKPGLKPPPAKGAAALPNAPKLPKDTSKSKATGHKAITINVSIKELIHEQNIVTKTLKEGSVKIKDMVVEALTGAINDFQVTAGV